MFSIGISWLFIGIQLVSLLIAIILHEIAHGYVAFRYGDPTAKNLGRLSINPIRHIDPMGSLLVPGLLMLTGSSVLFGWAKPVSIQPRYFKRPSYHMMLVALAGPLTNFTLAALAGLFFKLILTSQNSIISLSPLTMTIAIQGIFYFIQLNVLLGIFNLIPIPPLDGSRILSHFSPSSVSRILDRLEPYGFAIIYIGLFVGIIPKLLTFLVPTVTGLFVPDLS